MKIRKTIGKITLPLLLALSMITATACGNNADSSETAVTTSSETSSSQAESSQAESSGTESVSSVSESESSSTATDADLWKDAQYTEDTEVGKGEKSVQVEVSAGEKKITFTVHTDKKTLGDALTENNLVTGSESEYGLYIESVNGMKADYDTDKAYWAISKNGEYLQTGADSTDIADGEHYELTYTKG